MNHEKAIDNSSQSTRKQEENALQNEARSEMQASCTKDKNDSNGKASRNADSLDLSCNNLPGYGMAQDDLLRYNMVTRTGNHEPMDMQVQSGHSVPQEMQVFANPSMRPQPSVEVQGEEISVRAASHHHRRSHNSPQENTASSSTNTAHVNPSEPLSNSTVRIPDLPPLTPIPAPQPNWDHQRAQERARQAASHDPFRRSRR